MMKRFTLLISLLITQLFFFNVSAQINTGGTPVKPFGSNTRYMVDGQVVGIMPTNLPSGTYGGSQDAADAYNTWKQLYVESCNDGRIRVRFDIANETVSEGIAYGMLLSVYAADKPLFDGLWAYYQHFMNGNGVMDWKISGCSHVTQAGGATDAELDAALALIIASKQWPDNGSSYNAAYHADAISLIQTIKATEMANDGQTLNGDGWGNTNTCRNPSYQSPAYYRQFALVDVANASFWNTTAVNAASNLLMNNVNTTSGLISNWCDNNGSENSCGNTGSGAAGYGADACRNPWRMATDYLWHGSNACEAANYINAKLTDFVNGYENQLKGPFSNRNVSNPSSGSYVNGSYTTFALAPMTDANAQSSLNACYSAVAGLPDNDAYFNATVRCITMFMLTGNFWSPQAIDVVIPPAFVGAETNADGSEIYVTVDRDLNLSSSANGSAFTLSLNGSAQANAITSVSITDARTITLSVDASAAPQPGQTITLSFDGSGNIESTDGEALIDFSNEAVLNLLAGNETILDDCEDGNDLNNIGGIWFTFDDRPDQTAACQQGTISSIDPLSSPMAPLQMASPGYDGSEGAVHATFTLGAPYTPYNSGACASWENPAYVGLGTWVSQSETATMDWTSGVGVSFMYKGSACTFQVIIEEVTDYCFHKYDVPECTDWTQITVLWEDLVQPTWGTEVPFTALNVQKLQWQFETGVSGAAGSDGDFWIDDVRIMNMPPVTLTGLEVVVSDSSEVANPLYLDINNTEDTLILAVVPTPADATYPVALWSSSDENVVTIDYQGNVIVEGYGTATITATGQLHPNITATFDVEVPQPPVAPEEISFDPNEITISIGADSLLTPIFSSTAGPVTETGVEWTSNPAGIVSFGANGSITGTAIGTTVVTATSTAAGATSVSGSITVHVAEIDVTGVVASLSDTIIDLGNGFTIVASVVPDNATNQDIVWTSSNEAVATVDGGIVGSLSAGTTTIRAAAAFDTVNFYAEVTVEVLGIGVDTVLVEPDTLELLVGDVTPALVASVQPSSVSQLVTWVSDDQNVATVTGGIVTAEGEGETTIRVTSQEDDTKYTECVVIVSAIVTDSIVLNITADTLIVGANLELTATAFPTGASTEFNWSSSADAIATVDANGYVETLDTGLVVITVAATDGSGATASCSIYVAPVLVETIALNVTEDTIATSGSLQLLIASMTPNGVTDDEIVWTTDDDLVATVDADGYVSATGEGTTVITATAHDGGGAFATCSVTVIENVVLVETVTITTQISELGISESVRLTTTVGPQGANNRNINWSSSDDNYATVDVDGNVSGIAEGPVQIIATAADGSGVADTIEITIVPILPSTIVLSQDQLGFVINGDNQTLTYEMTPDNVTEGYSGVEWRTDDDQVATVVDGVVTPQGEGNCMIILTSSADATVGDTCFVSVVTDNVPVENVTLDVDTINIVINETYTLNERIIPDSATNRSVTWMSTEEVFATVSTSGVVTGETAGTSLIIVTSVDGGFSDTCVVIVSAVLVSEIIISEDTLNISLSASEASLTAVVNPDNATDTSFAWSSSNENIVVVDSDGNVTAQAEGNAHIIATANDGSGVVDSCYVIVSGIQTVPVTGVELDTHEINTTTSTISVSLVATVLPEYQASNTNVTWATLNDTVATVNQRGLVTIEGAGTADIVVTTEDGGFTDTCTVIVSDILVETITVSVSEINEYTNADPISLSALITPGGFSNSDLDWYTTNAEVVSVNGSGRVTVQGPGTAYIIAAATDGSGVADTVNVEILPVAVTGVELDSTSISLIEGGAAVQIRATVSPMDVYNDTITWESDNEDVATVVGGIVTPGSAGDAVITVTTADGGYTATCSVTVAENVTVYPVTGVTVNPTSLDLVVGDERQISLGLRPSYATNDTVTWESSDINVVTVDQNGNIVAVDEGDASVTVTTADGGFTATCEISVSPVLATSVNLNRTSLSMVVDGEFQLIATVYAGTEILDQTVNWESSSASVSVVDGLVTVEEAFEDTVNITAITTDGSDRTATCIVVYNSVDVTGVELDVTSLIMNINDDPYTLYETVYPENATVTDVEWETSAAVVTVDGGVVTPQSVGFATVTVTSVDNQFAYAECDIEVVDNAGLAAAIAAAEQTLNDAPAEGTEVGNMIIGSGDELQSAIDAAALVLDQLVSQSVIDGAIADLDAAVAYFETRVVTDGTLIFDAEIGNMTLLATYVYSYNDSVPGGASVISPLSSEENPFTTTLGGADDTDSAAMVEYTLDAGTLTYNPFVGFGFPFNADETAYDLTGSRGISFWYKGEASTVYVKLATNLDEDYYGHAIPASADWTYVELEWTNFAQNWGIAIDWDASQAVALQWQVQAAGGSTGQVWVDQVSVSGIVLDLPSLIQTAHLSDLIATANQLISTAESGTENGQYPEAAINTYVLAIDAATEVLNDPASTQAQIDAAFADLDTATTVFGGSIIGGVDPTELVIRVLVAEILRDFASVGTEIGEYPQDAFDAFEDAVAEADSIAMSAGLTQLALEQAIENLNAAIDVFGESQITEPAEEPVDFTDLTNEVTAANNLYNSVVSDSLMSGLYPEFAITDFAAAIAEAELVLNDSTSTQDEVDDAVDALQDATETFNEYFGYTSVEEVVVETKVYPVPCASVLTVEAAQVISKVTLTSIAGLTVVADAVDAASVEIDVTTIAAGEYVLTITYADGSSSAQTIVVE